MIPVYSVKSRRSASEIEMASRWENKVIDYEVGDIVRIGYNMTLGRVVKIHGDTPLHDVEGLDGFLYGNQLEDEIKLIVKIDAVAATRLLEWVR